MGRSRLLRLREAAFRAARAYRLFRRPLLVKLQRALGTREVRLADARTGLQFRCLQGADRMFHEVFLGRHYEVPLAPVRAGDLVVDVGANHGFVASWFAFRGAEVQAYEPSPRVCQLLKTNLVRNGLQDMVTVHCAAVADADGEADLLETPRMGGGMSSLEVGYIECSGAAVGIRTRVPVRSVRSVLAGLGERPVRLLKLDCEGSELKILTSLGQQEQERIESIALEYHAGVYQPGDLVAALEVLSSSFALSRPDTDGAPNMILHLVRHDVIRDAVLKALGSAGKS